ncbi:hypothetical protein RRG08_016324 [Elysia crispata]|uniref:Uncharacterized protein n=1 Tax=Elysia crispata TaxID=231223 RepID=A0AAE1E0P3_9GAST|nr:hypothetical protein RRG08_016324 [Elysia crispata]
MIFVQQTCRSIAEFTASRTGYLMVSGGDAALGSMAIAALDRGWGGVECLHRHTNLASTIRTSASKSD